MSAKSRSSPGPRASARQTRRHATHDYGAGTIEEDIKALERMTLGELRTQWTERLGGQAPPIQSPDVLRGLLACRIQAQAFGGLSPQSRRRLNELAKTFARDPRHAPVLALNLRPGTILSREWRGTMHRVEVTEDGFIYDGRRFDTLSELARHITGTRWSGPAFFGLRRSKPERAA